MQTQVNASVKISQDLHLRIKKIADARNRSAHAIMLQALETYIGREEKREALRIEAKLAHDEYMQTGLHLTSSEVKLWLAELAKGNDVEPPACHI